VSPAKALVDTRTGTEGIETIMWLVMRGALQENVNVIHKHYHAPISNGRRRARAGEHVHL